MDLLTILLVLHFGILLITCLTLEGMRWWFFVLLGVTGIQAQFKRTETIRTDWGGIRGFVVQPPVPSLRPVDVYLGIPYGQPPTGDRRFMPPQTKSKWTGKVKDALTNGPVCPQTAAPRLGRRAEVLQNMPPLRYDFLRRLQPKLERQSEDCLYLNLFVPQRQGKLNALPFHI